MLQMMEISAQDQSRYERMEANRASDKEEFKSLIRGMRQRLHLEYIGQGSGTPVQAGGSNETTPTNFSMNCNREDLLLPTPPSILFGQVFEGNDDGNHHSSTLIANRPVSAQKVFDGIPQPLPLLIRQLCHKIPQSLSRVPVTEVNAITPTTSSPATGPSSGVVTSSIAASSTAAALTTTSTSPLLHSCINSDSIETALQMFDGVHQPLSTNVATFEKPLRKLTFAHLVETTNDFSVVSLLGSGGLGEVFKAKLADGSVVAVKKLVSANGQGDRGFTAERETTGNLVPLLGYCKVGEARLLVYEYMKLGSLDILLQTKPKFLDGATRKRIAMGSARGLAFLHHSCIPHATHRDMKLSNVLLDENLEAQVFDFSMARPMNAIDAHLSVSTQQKDK